MLTTPFLTQVDSRAAVKGSRDPLGIQSIWSRLGRQVIGNLTTVSTSVRDFTVLLLGYYFVEQVAEGGGGDSDLATFLKWEQLAAYSRAHVLGDDAFRGTERVAKRLADGEGLRLGSDPKTQILGNQKIYGLWGLYTVPAKSSGLLQGDPTRLTDEGRAIVEKHLLPQLAAEGSHLVRGVIERLRAPTYELNLGKRSRDEAVLQAVSRPLAKLSAPVRAAYREHLLYGGSNEPGTRDRQILFAELLTETLADADWALTPKSVESLAARAEQKRPIGSELSRRLHRIRTAELLLAPAAAFFEFVLGHDERSIESIAAAVRETWGNTLRQTIDFEATRGIEQYLRMAGNDGESGQRWLKLAEALHSARYDDAVELVLAQNAAVMKARGGAAPWAAIQEGTLKVKFRDEQPGKLPSAGELPEYWRHAYFIESLRNMADQLQGAS